MTEAPIGTDPIVAALTAAPYTHLALEILLRERNPRPVTPCSESCCHWSSPCFLGDVMGYPAWLVWHWHALVHQRAGEG